MMIKVIMYLLPLVPYVLIKMNYAIIDLNNNIINTIVVEDESFVKDYILNFPSGFKILQYNSDDDAGPGGTYMNISNKDIFIAPKPYPSWILNEEYKWVAPIDPPQTQENHFIYWDELQKNWITVFRPPQQI